VSGLYDPERTATFYDEYGEREWTRFEDDRTPRQSLDVHLEHLRRFVDPGDRVLDVGAGPGRFTLELARMGCDVVVADLSPGQLEDNRRRLVEAGLEERVVERVRADVTDLSRWSDESFDAAVCYGGPLSYVLDDAGRGVAELVRVVKPRRHVLVSVMSLVGTLVHYFPIVLDLVRRDGAEKSEEIVRSGFLPEGDDYGHLAMKLYRWSELEALLAPHGTIVAAAAAGLLPGPAPPEPELREFVARIELEMASEPGALACGQHILAVVKTPA
jgi:ubiquinone/menaquinone biosynthesis C-methylase UbiE